MHDFAMDLVVFGLWVLALARATHLITADRITDFLKVWAYKLSKSRESWLTYFLTCPWCVSMWVGFGTSWAVFLYTGWNWWLYPIVSLAGSYVVGVFAENLEDDDDIQVEITND